MSGQIEMQKKLFSLGQDVSTRKYKPSREEYKDLCDTNGYVSSGYHIDDDDERKEYVKSIPTGYKVLNEDRILKFRGSDETLDRAGDIMRVSGCDMKNFRKNPLFLWMHNREKAVGRCIKVWKEMKDTGATNGKSVMFLIYFPEDTADDVDETYQKYNEGIYNAVSVGFIPKEINSPKTPEEREKVGLEPFGWGVEIKKWELLELSGVTVPCNQNALRTDKSAEEEDGLKAYDEVLKHQDEMMSVLRTLASDVKKVSRFIQNKNLKETNDFQKSDDAQHEEADDHVDDDVKEFCDEIVKLFGNQEN